jgi:signal transduction histidine kinase
MQARHIDNFLTPESAALIDRQLKDLLSHHPAGDKTSPTRILQVDQVHRAGHIIPTEVAITLLVDANNRLTQILGITRDITERRQTEAALQRFNTELEGKVAQRTEEVAARSQQIEALLNAIPDTVMRLHADGSVLFSQRTQSSPRLAAITPMPQEPPTYQAGVELLTSCLTLGRRALAEKTTVTNESRIETPGGTLDLELRTAPTGADEFVVFTRDITARKRLEAETAALLEREYQVSAMKTRFISVTSHEFRTPLTAIMTSAELLANHHDRLAPEKRKQYFERIFASLQRMTVMLDDVLTLNRMDAHRTELQLASIELGLVMQAIVQEIQTSDRQAHPFTLQVPAPGMRFVTDPKLFHHILSNLASNAARYSPAGQPVIIRAQCDEWRLQLVIEDRGIGVPAGDRSRIFEPFERGSNVGNIKGTGLGLNIVKRMTELLGGTITLEDVEGGGSRFVLFFPLLALPVSPKPT